MDRQYHLMFEREQFGIEKASEAVRKFVKSGFFRDDIGTKKIKIEALNLELCQIFECSVPAKIVWVGGFEPRGQYQFQNNLILLDSDRISIVTFLHEFAHFLFFAKNIGNDEEKAKGFSHSIYFLATPRLFENAVNKGLLLFQKSMGE